MTLAEARQKCIDAGITDPTQEDISLAGWDAPDWLQDVALTPTAETPEQMLALSQAAMDEAKSANVPAQVLEAISKLGSLAIKLAMA